MANKYKLNITDDHLAALNDDPNMEGVSLEAKDEAGNKVLITLVKSGTTPVEDTEEIETVEQPDAELEISDEEVIGNVTPEETAAMKAESVGFTNESRISSFDQFLKS